MSKSIKDLSIREIEEIDKSGYYFSTKEKAENILKKSTKEIAKMKKNLTHILKMLQRGLFKKQSFFISVFPITRTLTRKFYDFECNPHCF